jgi:hypothetical protein
LLVHAPRPSGGAHAAGHSTDDDNPCFHVVSFRANSSPGGF